MRRIKLIRTLISVIGPLLGLWLALGGLELRIFGSYLQWHQQISPIAYPEHIFRISAATLGGLDALAWPMVVFGTSWGGALVGFWIGERWSIPAMIILSTLALAFPFVGTALGIAQLILILSTPELRQLQTERIDES
ncbi:MAG: hypothetical protein PVF85_08065 [Anaerolineales bacterium]|jgi:hypothetical protein